MTGVDPITAGLGVVDKVLDIVAGQLPDEETKRAIFKEKHPKRYARIRRRLYRDCLNHLRFRWHEDIDTWVELTCGGLLQDERNYIKKLIHSTLKR